MRVLASLMAFFASFVILSSATAEIQKALTISLPIPGPADDDDSAGGLLVADIDDDGRPG